MISPWVQDSLYVYFANAAIVVCVLGFCSIFGGCVVWLLISVISRSVVVCVVVGCLFSMFAMQFAVAGCVVWWGVSWFCCGIWVLYLVCMLDCCCCCCCIVCLSWSALITLMQFWLVSAVGVLNFLIVCLLLSLLSSLVVLTVLDLSVFQIKLAFFWLLFLMVNWSIWVGVVTICKVEAPLEIMSCLLFVSRIRCGNGCFSCDRWRAFPGTEVL